MKLDPQMSLDDFSVEMQHRVVRYSLRSLMVRQALRFARKHKNLEYYRVASNKIHAQRQFLRELNGPSTAERMFDYFSLGSLREVVVTLMMVGVAVLGIDAGRKALNRLGPTTSLEHMDVDQLARRLDLLLDETHSAESQLLPGRPVISRARPVAHQSSGEIVPRVSDGDVQKIVVAVLAAIEQSKSEVQQAPVEVNATQPPPTETSSIITPPPQTGDVLVSTLSDPSSPQ